MGSGAATQRDVAIDAGVVVALTVVAYLLRSSGLGPSSLWLDDAWVALVYRADNFPDVWRMGLTAPGFGVVLKIWLDGVGLSSGAAQAIPFTAAVLTPGAAYLVGRRLRLRVLPALLAGLLVALAPDHATYSVRVKQYTVDALLVTVLVWLGLRASDRPDDAAGWRLLAVAGAAATVVSTALIPAAATIGVAALFPGARSRARTAPRAAEAILRWPGLRWVAAYLAFAVVWGAWMVAGRLSDRLNEYWEGFYLQSWSDLGRISTTVVGGLLGESHGLAVTVVVLLWLVGAVLAVRRSPGIALLLWGPPAAALLLAAIGASPLGTGRTELYLYPVLALGLASAVADLTRRLPAPPHRDAAMVALLAVTVAVATPLVAVDYPQQDLRPLVEVVQDRLEPTDQVLVSPSAAYATALYGPWMTGIRRNRTPLGFSPRFTERVTVIRVSGDVSHIERKYGDLPAGTRVWLLSAHVRGDRLEIARATLGDLGFEQIEESSRPGADLELWSRSG